MPHIELKAGGIQSANGLSAQKPKYVQPDDDDDRDPGEIQNHVTHRCFLNYLPASEEGVDRCIAAGGRLMHRG